MSPPLFELFILFHLPPVGRLRLTRCQLALGPSPNCLFGMVQKGLRCMGIRLMVAGKVSDTYLHVVPAHRECPQDFFVVAVPEAGESGLTHSAGKRLKS